MGKSPKTFWDNTSKVSEKRIKVILKYVQSKTSRSFPKEEPTIRMSDLNDSLQSFKKGGAYNSTFAESDDFDSIRNIQPDMEIDPIEKKTVPNPPTDQTQNTSFVSRSIEDQNVIYEATNEQILVPPKPARKIQPKNQVVVKILVEELDNSSEDIKIHFNNTPVDFIMEDSFASKELSKSFSNYSIDSLNDLSGLNYLNHSNKTKLDTATSFVKSKKSFGDEESFKNDKSFLDKLNEFETWIISRQRKNERQKFQEPNNKLLKEHENDKTFVEKLDKSEHCIRLDNITKKKNSIRNNKSLKEEFAECENLILSEKSKNSILEKTTQNLLDEFECFKKRVLAPTDAFYYSPQTKSKREDEKVANIIRDLVLKRFKETRKEKSRKPRKNAKLFKTIFRTSAESLEPNMTNELNKRYMDETKERNRNTKSLINNKTTYDQEIINTFKSETKLSPKFAQESKISTEYETINELGCDKKSSNEYKLEYEKTTDNVVNNAKQCEFILASLQEMTVDFPGVKSNKVAYIAKLLSNQNQLKEKTRCFKTPVSKPNVETSYVNRKPTAGKNFVQDNFNFNSSIKANTTDDKVDCSYNLNRTSTKNTPVCHVNKKDNPKDLESSTSTGSEGVYDCSKNTVLAKKDIVPYFKEIENISCQYSAKSGREGTYEDIQYDSTKFLKEALGSEMEMSSNASSVNKLPIRVEPIYDRSIDTDNISTLISSESFPPIFNRKLRRNFNSANTFTSSVLTETSYNDLTYEAKYQSINSDDNKAGTCSQHDSGMSSADAAIKKHTRKSLPNVAKNNKEIFGNKRQSCPLYEDIENVATADNNTTDIQKDLFQKVAQQEELIKQAESVIMNGFKRRHFYGSVAHLEAEKIRLISNIRKNVFEKQIMKEDMETPKEEPALAKLVIKNVLCTSSFPANEKWRKKQHFFGVFQNDTTVLCTSYSQPNMFGDVEFDGQFTFNDLKSDFEIKFSLYTLAIQKKNTIDKISCFRNSLKRNFPGRYLELVGTHKFEKSTVGTKKPIKLDNHKDYFASYKFCAISHLFIKPNEPLKGVLTIGSEIKGHPVWNSRWCVLEGTKLKLYLFPSDEFYGNPFAHLDLKYCESCELDSNTKTLFKSSALKLTFVKNNAKVVKFLVADDKNQILNWQKQILMAKKIAKSW